MPSSAKLLVRLLALVALGLAVRQWTNRPQAPAAPPVSPALQVVQQALKNNRVMVRQRQGQWGVATESPSDWWVLH